MSGGESQKEQAEYSVLSAPCCADESALAPLLACARTFESIAQKLEAEFSVSMKLANGVQASTVLRLIRKLRSISNREYRNLVGMLNYVREDSNGASLEMSLQRIARSDLSSPELREICELLKSIYAQGYEYHAASNPLFDGSEGVEIINPCLIWDRDFSDRSLRLLRALYPLGVNMQNPELRADVASGLSTAERITIVLPTRKKQTAFIHIIPNDNESQIVHAVRGSAQPEFAPLALREREFVLIGRKLTLKELYGKIFDHQEIEVPVLAQIKDDNVSRGGVMVMRLNNKLYLFDRGSRHEVKFSGRAGEWTHYRPQSRSVESGYDLGESGVFYREELDC